MVKAIGLRVKSGWVFPSGRFSINCVIITPGTLDFFLIPTVSIRKWNVTNNIITAGQFTEKQYIFKAYYFMIIQSSPISSKSHRKVILICDILECLLLIDQLQHSSRRLVVDSLPSHVIYIHISNDLLLFLQRSLKFKVYYIYIILLKTLVWFFMPFEVLRRKKATPFLLKPYQRRSLRQDLMKHIWQSIDVRCGWDEITAENI